MLSAEEDPAWRSVRSERPFAVDGATGLLKGAFLTFVKGFVDGPGQDPVTAVSVAYFANSRIYIS